MAVGEVAQEGRVLRVGDLDIDWSRQHLAPAEGSALLAGAVGDAIHTAREAMFGGAHLNGTEGRAVGHVALRMAGAEDMAGFVVDGEDQVPAVRDVVDRVCTFADAVRRGELRGARGKRFGCVVAIGIGGSHLGPAMAVRALSPLAALAPAQPSIGDGAQALDVRFVSNVDPAAIAGALAGLDPETTLVVVCSKTFTTQETMRNAVTVRQWLVDAHGGDESVIADHVAAVSTALDRVAAFGIRADRTFGFWDWVGGRFSLTSAVGLPVALACGGECFRALLSGAHVVDEHFRSAPLVENAPAVLGLVRWWNRTVLGAASHAVLPYAERLALWPAYLQQLEMESLGKSVTLDGAPVEGPTGAVVWGAAGTDAQHSFLQLLHQGTDVVPVDFIGFARPDADVVAALGSSTAWAQHEVLLANLLAQSEALWVGRSADTVAAAGERPELVAHRTFVGGRPSTVVLAPELTPSVLGQLVALAEHTVAVQGALFGINAYDQFGVELGKSLASEVSSALAGRGASTGSDDAVTARLVAYLRMARERDA